MSNALGNQEELTKKVALYEKALEEITRQHKNTSVNRAKDIADKALGELSKERRLEIQSVCTNPLDIGKTKTRLDVLLEVLGNPEDVSIVTLRHITSGEVVDENGTEFFVGEERKEKCYDVLKEEEIQARLEDLLNDCYSEEELEETYGRDQEGNIDLTTADIGTYLELVGTSGVYSIYTEI